MKNYKHSKTASWIADNPEAAKKMHESKTFKASDVGATSRDMYALNLDGAITIVEKSGHGNLWEKTVFFSQCFHFVDGYTNPMLDAVRKSPGSSFTELSKLMGIGKRQAARELRKMRDEGLIKILKVPGKRAYSVRAI